VPLRSLAALGLVLAVVPACQQASRPVVKQQTFSAAAGAIEVVAVVPFYPRPELRRNLLVVGSQDDPEKVAALVTSFFTDALRAESVRIVTADDIEMAFTNAGMATPRRDPRAAAQLASRAFGATSVVLGEVYRWRDRKGQTYGAEQPASVGYAVDLYGVADGRRLWSSRFDHTQRTLTGDPLTARKYPGGGSRWLTAAELARWGAAAASASLVEGQWRGSK
jgi:hypothetical protein